MSSAIPVQTLIRRGDPLADAGRQLQILEGPREDVSVPAFDATLAARRVGSLTAGAVRVLQVNLGKLCNQTCRHCHVDAGPERREIMTRETMQECLAVLSATDIETVDITGGAPEMNPGFEWFVTEVRRLGRTVIDRCNLTILTAPGYAHLAEFLAEQRVHVVASLPCYLEENCDWQRGDGVFQRSIAGLQKLNDCGYAIGGAGLELSLVYNPVGPSLPPDQQQLESAYRDQLRTRFGIEFTRLYTITNMPISRFLADLLQSGRYAEYMQKLLDAFNPVAAAQVMCRDTLSVDWQGNLFDCDFNQMLGLRVHGNSPGHIRDFSVERLEGRPIVTGRHCYGCTAGAGSSCQGALTS